MAPVHRLRINSHRKNGPPTSAVITPTGSSSGDMTVRAPTSHTTRKAAPKHAEAGSTTRWSEPTSKRTRCGMTMPMKPIGPANETAAPVASDALKKAIEANDEPAMSSGIEALNSAQHKAAEVLYQQGATPSPEGDAPRADEPTTSPSSDGDVIDAEVVGEDKK